MKRITSILLVVTLLTSIISLSSCDDKESSEKEYTKVTLTTRNYSDYIVFDYYTKDQDIEARDNTNPITNVTTTVYDVSGSFHIESKSANESYRFDKVVIELSGKVSMSSNTSRVSIQLTLNSRGVANGSNQYFLAGVTSSQIKYSNLDYYVNEISGTVRVPK